MGKRAAIYLSSIIGRGKGDLLYIIKKKKRDDLPIEGIEKIVRPVFQFKKGGGGSIISLNSAKKGGQNSQI